MFVPARQITPGPQNPDSLDLYSEPPGAKPLGCLEKQNDAEEPAAQEPGGYLAPDLGSQGRRAGAVPGSFFFSD